MIRNFLRNITLASMLTASAFAQQPTSQPTKHTVSALGKVYTYQTAEAKILAERVMNTALKIQGEHDNKPYVWGGDGFESLEEQKKLYGEKIVTDKQPSGNWRSGQPTVPGVDDSGLVFQVYLELQKQDKEDQKKKGTSEKEITPHFTYGRIPAEKYLKLTEIIVPKKEKNDDEVKEKALPGDLVFIYEKSKPVQVSVYVGNDVILIDRETKKDITDIPADMLKKWREETHPEKSKKRDNDYGGIQVANIGDEYKDAAIAVGRLPDFLPPKPKKK